MAVRTVEEPSSPAASSLEGRGMRLRVTSEGGCPRSSIDQRELVLGQCKDTGRTTNVYMYSIYVQIHYNTGL